MTSFGLQFDSRDVIYHVQPCNIDNRWSNVFKIMDVTFEKYVKIRVPVLTRVTGNSNPILA